MPADTRHLLSVHVVWDHASPKAADQAAQIFAELRGDPRHPGVRGLGIDVRHWSSQPGDPLGPDDPPATINLDEAEHNIVVVLIDDPMVDSSVDWRTHLSDLKASLGPEDRYLPAVSTRNASKLTANDAVLRLFEPSKTNDSLRVINRLLHEIYGLLTDQVTPSINVFLSHAKADGLRITRAVQSFMTQETAATDFFDTTDIPPGTQFATVIEQAVRNSAVLVAVQTDDYASREWCRLEVLHAKRMRIPIVVLAAVATSEVRSFPYLGNVPVIRWKNAAALGSLVHALLREAVRRVWFPKHIADVCARAGVEPPDDVFIYPPELLTAMLHRAASGLALDVDLPFYYPDPPLGHEEIELLAAFDPKLAPRTLAQLLT